MVKRKFRKNFILSLIVLGGIAIAIGMGYTILYQQKAGNITYVNDVSAWKATGTMVDMLPDSADKPVGSVDIEERDSIQNPSGKPEKVNAAPDTVQDTGHLVYKNYGDKAVPMEQGNILRLENIQSLLAESEISGIFLYHFETQSVVKEFPVDTTGIEYEVAAEGHYSVYAVTVNDETINLSKDISVEHVVPGADGVQYNEEANQSGFINLIN